MVSGSEFSMKGSIVPARRLEIRMQSHRNGSTCYRRKCCMQSGGGGGSYGQAMARNNTVTMVTMHFTNLQHQQDPNQ